MKNLALPTALVISFAGIPGAYAQDNLEEALQGNIDRLAEEGGEITYSSSSVGSGGAVTYNDFVLLGEDDVRISSDWVTITPVEGKPGSVTVTTAPVISFAVTDGAPEMHYEMEIIHDNFSFETNLLLMTVQAKPEFSMTADSLQFKGLTEGHPVVKDLDITQTGFAMSFALDDEAGTIDGGWKADTLNGGYRFEPEPGNLQAASMDTEGFEVSFDVSGFAPYLEFDEWLNSGGEFHAGFTSGASTSDTTITSPEFSMQMAGTSGPGEGSISVEGGDFSYRVTSEGISYQVTPLSDALPIPPFDVALASAEMVIEMPLLASDAARKMNFVIDFEDLAIGEGLWMLLDPGQGIPRDPVNLEVRLNADLTLNQSVVELADQGPQGNPFAAATFEKVTVTAVNANIGGASVQASGDLDVNNQGPIPQPLGAIDVEVNGAQTLSQKLVDLGLVDQMQAGMVMGMMMAFGVPGDQPDQFLSKIEFKPEGIFANGQPLQ